MSVEEARRQTAPTRRAKIIETLSRELDRLQDRSAAQRLGDLIAGATRPMVVSADIDGLVSAAMLAQVTGWRAVALVVKSDKVYLHPDVADTDLAMDSLFGVDVFSTRFPSVSNHVALWGGRALGGDPGILVLSGAYDSAVQAAAERTLLANPSLWAGVEGSYSSSSAANRPTSAMYRYPLGTAQFLLALLEASGYPPRLFDREYLPWLIANCDGGVESFEKFHWNAPMWWSCMAAAVGPASLSEHVYQVVRNQRPNEFRDVVNRLRSEDAATALHLSGDWNLRSQGLDDIEPVLRWITAISGWADPIRGGADNLSEWTVVTPAKGTMDIARLPTAQQGLSGVEVFKMHLRNSLRAVHTNFAFFNPDRLTWMLPWDGLVEPATPLPAALEPAPPPASPPPADLA